MKDTPNSYVKNGQKCERHYYDNGTENNLDKDKTIFLKTLLGESRPSKPKCKLCSYNRKAKRCVYD